MSILIENISKQYGNLNALKNVNLEINSGSLTALVGPSGSGKSTLLRIIGGFEKPDNGRIWLFGQDTTFQTIEAREIGFVFQNYALFPHLNVWENIAFGLKVKKVPVHRISKRVKELLELIQLENFSEAYPYELSGGQRQRVALARAIAVEPKLLLLDEPFGALDPKVRKELRDWLKNLHTQIPLTTLLVTHDQQEAMEIADELVVFCDGKVEQFGTPQEIYDSPANSFVMNFVGNSNKIIFSTMSSKFFSMLLTKATSFNNRDEKITIEEIYVRPHGFSLTATAQENSFPVIINKIIYGESLIKLELISKDFNEIFKIQTSRNFFEKFLEKEIINQTEVFFLLKK
uniref:Probable transport protein n=1 Tax=Pedinomonas tuberculata TaxID=160064 RepID=A0A097KL43_9CHLO|nr:probable transport protein [Pedinomonas tuberculata]AIT93887.1 probable transport protein [Pedinomonas tuberculata]